MGKISKKEVDEAMSQLRRQGLSKQDTTDVRNALSGHGDQYGVTKKELEDTMKQLDKHPGHLSKEQREKARKELGEDLKD